MEQTNYIINYISLQVLINSNSYYSYRQVFPNYLKKKVNKYKIEIERIDYMMEDNKNDIVIFENQGLKLEVNIENDSVWLNRKQLAELFDRDVKTIGKHVKNVLKEELKGSEDEAVKTFKITANDNKEYDVEHYNLDVIISVGYRVKSKKGIIFRRWANNVLKEYLIKGYAINSPRMKYLGQIVELVKIATRGNERINDTDLRSVLETIERYSEALDMLDDYDHKSFSKIEGNSSKERISYEDCIRLIDELRELNKSDVFAVEKNQDMTLESIINNVYASYGGDDVYLTIEEKAANFLYFVTKDHVFADGNKRIAATLFIYFLDFYDILYKDGKQVIDNSTLTALTILVAESNREEKDILIDLIMHFISK